MAAKLLPCITTTNLDITKIQIQELQQNNISELGLFITGLNSAEQRINFLKKLKSTLPNTQFPFVHVRIDSKLEELVFCVENFNTKWFNVHANHAEEFKDSPLYIFKPKMLAENSKQLNIKDLKYFAGICLDLSHWYEDIMNNEEWVNAMEHSIEKYSIICNHISAVKVSKDVWAEHIGNCNTDFNYLKKIPKNLFGTEYLCLELENTITTQLKFIDYIKTLLV